MLGRQNRKVRMYLKDGPTIEGVMAGRTREEYILWAPRLIASEGAEPVILSAHVEVPKRNVLFYQVIG